MMAERYFTLEEAQSLVGWVQNTFDEVASLRKRVGSVEGNVSDLIDHMRANGRGQVEDEFESRHNTLRHVSRLVANMIDSLERRGIIVRNIEQGLIDFPAMREGHEIYLCWVSGEKQIEYWHEIDAGFAGRQLL